jgi:hypothetical protein
MNAAKPVFNLCSSVFIRGLDALGVFQQAPGAGVVLGTSHDGLGPRIAVEVSGLVFSTKTEWRRRVS